MTIRRIKLCRTLAVLTALAVLAGGMPAAEAASVIHFNAYIDYGPQGYVVYGDVAEFPAGTCRIQTLYSLDGENYQTYHREWTMPGSIESAVTTGCAVKTPQICLQSNDEPLCSYLAGELNRFYVKLRVTTEDGTICESGTVLIERNSEPLPIPEGVTVTARFSSSMRVRGPSGFYGRYQLTVCAAADMAEITAQLPDTIPVEVQVGNGICTVDCPVTWKPLSTVLTAGESVTIADAAEAIAVPAGTLLNTPLGVYRLKEALPLTVSRWDTGEVRLVLNAVSEGESPSGGLAVDRGELKMVFDKKPTGATAIRAYTLAGGENTWTEIHGLSLLEAVNAQPSTANSRHARVCGSQEEPYRSYLAAEAAGLTPVPFLVGFKIEGGVYDGQQLVLAWPGHYELPPNLPDVGSGSGGNEGNAGSDNKDDSTEGGQRPNLPQQPEDSGNESPGGSGDTQPGDGGNQPSDNNGDKQPSGGSDTQPGDGSAPGGSGSQQPPDGGDGESRPGENGNQPSDNNGDKQPSGGSDTQPEDGSAPGGSGSQQPHGGGRGQISEEGNASGGTGQIPEEGNASGGTETKYPGTGNVSGGTGQRPNLPNQPENPASNHESVLRILKMLLDPAAAVSVPEDGTVRMRRPVGGSAAFLGTACVAAVCAAVSARAAIARLCGRIIGRIRSILCSIFR